MANLEEKVTVRNALGPGVDPMQRLASFKPPRDYTLGAAKPKKLFTPNLITSRNKSKGPAVPSSPENKKKVKGKKERKNNRNNKNGPDVIRSSSVFSEGVGNEPQHASQHKQAQNLRTPATPQKPTIRVKDVVNEVDKKLEPQKDGAVAQNGNFVEEVGLFKQSTDSDAPIKLPLDMGWSLGNKPRSGTAQPELQLKKEPMDDNIRAREQKKPIPEVKKEFSGSTDVVDLLQSNQPTLMLIKFPDTLPERVVHGEEGSRGLQQQEASSSTASARTERDSAQEQNKCNLRDLDEGRIGKLQVHRSGRVTLLLGDTSFEVTLSTNASYHQEVVSMTADEPSRTAEVVGLGELCHKLTVFPDFEGMLSREPP